MTDNADFWTPVKAVFVAVTLNLSLWTWVTNVPWVGVGTFCTIILNGLYIRYKWRKSEEFNKIGLRKAQIELAIKEEELRQLIKLA